VTLTRNPIPKTLTAFSVLGFFGSSLEKSSARGHRNLRYLSIGDHAHDAMEVLQSYGYDHADVVVGHSMGVAVALEFSLQ